MHERIVFFPVRHHSPACARLVTQLIREMRPAAVLIEGPADFNSRLDELSLDHQLPIAIYSYFAADNGQRFGAFYPFFDFSPEWGAFRTARETGATVAFIDLPWADVAHVDRTANRYADGLLARSSYTAELCRRLGVDDWSTLWDTLFEIDPALSLPAFLERCHSFCFHARIAEDTASAADLAREAFMLEQIRATASAVQGQVLVVTGGFHSAALFAGWHGNAAEEAATNRAPPAIVDRGIALTPYSHERLDTLSGYEAGLPHPGFYHRVWQDGSKKNAAPYRTLLSEAAAAMRARGQRVSTADLVGVEAFAQGLATLRGHATVWRTDLVDALLGTLIKDDLGSNGRHPFLDALNLVFRGSARGRLAAGTSLPPLVDDIRRTLELHDLTPTAEQRKIEIDLDDPHGRARSQILHRARILGLPGFTRAAGTDFVARRDLSRLWETWTVRWSPEFEAACIELSFYGASLLDAVAARLLEKCARIERDADAAAQLLLDASLAGWSAGFARLRDRLVALIRDDASFASVARALEHLYYLYRYDEFVAREASGEIGELLTECYTRAIWLLEAQAPSANAETIHGLRALLHAVLTAGTALDWDRTELLSVLHRIANERHTPALLRGASAGALWSLGEGELDQVVAALPSDGDALGDFLQGVFALAREESQRHTALLVNIDRLLLGFDADQFLAALPSLRLAFTYFTPREKDHLARALLDATGQTDIAPLPQLAVTADQAARAHAFESRLMRELALHGLRGGIA